MEFDLSLAKDGILLVDKPVGWTSFDVCAKIRGQIKAGYRARDEKPTKRQLRVGHAGTLDPFATGLLIILLGDATRQADTFLKQDKTYEATIRLGQSSSTGDPEGELTTISDIEPDRKMIEETIKRFVGEIVQTPPAYSAIKINGQRAYKLAREGKVVDVPTRQVTIHTIELVSYDYPELKIRTHVSSGTYIRSLAEDIGSALGTGAYCKELRRTSIGDYKLDKEKTMSERFSDTEPKKAEFSIDTNGGYVTSLRDRLGRPVLFDLTEIDGKKRGGSHVCLPGFGADESGKHAQHGFGRGAKWEVMSSDDSETRLRLINPAVDPEYENGAYARYAGLTAELTYKVEADVFQTTLTARNDGEVSVPFEPGFHPYFAYEDENSLWLDGELLDVNAIDPAITPEPSTTKRLMVDGRTITLHSDSLTSWVVWTDKRGNYVCIEPTFDGPGFDSESPRHSLAPGKTETYGYSIQFTD